MRIIRHLIVALLVCVASGAVQAQYIFQEPPDTLQNYPFLYHYLWDDMGTYHNDTLCNIQTNWMSVPRNTRAHWGARQTEVHDIALYQQTDSVLHAIGIACYPVTYASNQYHLGLYDENMETIREITAVASLHVNYSITNHHIIDSGFFHAFSFPAECPIDGNGTHGVLLQFSFFDEPIDITGNFYISYGKGTNWSGSVMRGCYVREFHEPPYHVGRIPIRVYFEDEKKWVDDTMEHELPALFLVIEPECKVVDEVRVSTDSLRCVVVEWDSLPWQEEWVLRLEGPSGTRYDTVDTCFFRYCGLDADGHYEVSVRTQCYRPGGHYWSDWSDAWPLDNNVILPAEAAEGHLTLSPNPTTGRVTVAAEGFQGPATVSLHDARGADVLRHEGVVLPLLLDTENLAAGVYLLHVNTKEFHATEKLVVGSR